MLKRSSKLSTPQSQLEKLAEQFDASSSNEALTSTLKTISTLKAQGADLNNKMDSGSTPAFVFMQKALTSAALNPIPFTPQANFVEQILKMHGDPRIANQNNQNIFQYIQETPDLGGSGMLLQYLWENFTGLCAFGTINAFISSKTVADSGVSFFTTFDPHIPMAQIEAKAEPSNPDVPKKNADAKGEPSNPDVPKKNADAKADPSNIDAPKSQTPTEKKPTSLNPKLNRGYLSFKDYLLGHNLSPSFANSFPPIDYGYLYGIDDQRKTYGYRDQLRGGLQPLKQMWKDVINTVKPYKSATHLLRDLLQPLRGLANLGKAALYIVGAPLVLFVNTLTCCFSPATFVAQMKLHLARTASWLVDGITSAIRGATQLFSFPFTWMRIILRSIITEITGAPVIEDSKAIQRFVTLGKQDPLGSHRQTIHQALHLKFRKGLARGQQTTIDEKEEERLFKANDNGYLKLFEKKTPQSNAAKKANSKAPAP